MEKTETTSCDKLPRFSLFIPAEPFTQEELEEMLSAAVDPDKGVVLYKDYASLMAVDETAWNRPS